MQIFNTNPMTGKPHAMEIDVTPEQIEKWQNGMHIQYAMPNLTADEREFFITGHTPETWDALFPEE